MLLPIFVSGLLLIACAANGQPADGSGLLEWNQYYKLQWDDFRGEPGEGAAGDAGAAVQIRATPFLEGKNVHYDVYAYFNRGKSWARDTSEALLAHEQLHFDIAELYARKIRRLIAELGRKNVSGIKEYNKAIQQLLDESNAVDRQYDIETLHGSLTGKQGAWEEKVRKELDSLRRFKKQRRIISARQALPVGRF